MFRGIHAVNLDTKGRMAIPARYRQRLQDDAQGKLVVTIDTDEHCLLIYPMSEWEAIEAKIEALPSFNQVTRRIQRLLIGHATEVEIDGNGRILLPPLLRDYAHLDKRTILLGQGKKFELWSESHWQLRRDDWMDRDSDDAGDLPTVLDNLTL
ncbi:MAG: cell division/cell wall cluster transcriptional repressor MraZ [Legionellaceae bacterium]|nr:cell division/cell wall cluster transcriptional repressor MraZ [Legionellaceae bacterium]